MTNKINKCDGNHGGPRCAYPECWNGAPVPPAGYAPCSPELLESGVDCATAPRWSSPTWDGHSHWHPVPPAGVEPEVLAWIDRSTDIGVILTLTGEKSSVDNIGLVDRAHVTRLQADVELWKGRTTNICQARAELQAELTKALELLRDINDAPGGSSFRKHIEALLSNQSAPADKCQGEPVADALSTGFYVTESGGGKYAINIGFRSMAEMQAADQQLRDLFRARHAEQPAPVAVLPEKYDDVLLPFLSLMRAELHANARKGDRPGWLQMDRKTAVLEVFYHMGKLHMAVHRNDKACITEYAADVANMCMMLTDVCGCLNSEQKP